MLLQFIVLGAQVAGDSPLSPLQLLLSPALLLLLPLLLLLLLRLLFRSLSLLLEARDADDDEEEQLFTITVAID